MKKAIEQAAVELGDRARKVVPDVMLAFQMQPQSKSFIYPTGEGILVTIEVPAIEATSVMLYLQTVEQLNRQNNPLRTIGTAAPPAVTTGAVGPLVALTNPEKEYAELARQGIVDAMLDFAFALPIKDKQTLTVSAGTISPGPANPLAQVERRLYLTVKAEDLLALRENRITRDEAKARIIEKRY